MITQNRCVFHLIPAFFNNSVRLARLLIGFPLCYSDSHLLASLDYI